MKNFRMTVYPALEVGMTSKTFEFQTQAEMDAAHYTAASLLIFIQDDMELMNGYSNTFIKERFIDGEWTEVLENEITYGLVA